MVKVPPYLILILACVGIGYIAVELSHMKGMGILGVVAYVIVYLILRTLHDRTTKRNGTDKSV